MKALICTRPGLVEYTKRVPPELTPGHAILKIKRIGICGTDLHAYGGTQPYFNYPRILGHELAADLIEADGADSFVPGEAIGAHGVRRAKIIKDEFVLVIGAGPIGLGTMQFAKIAGAKVIAFDINESRLNFCKEKLKIDYALNADDENLFAQIKDITSGDMPTVIIDATGSKKAINNALQYLAHGGRFVLIGLQKEEINFSHPEFHKREATLMSSRNATREDFELVIKSIKNGLVDASVFITHQLLFDDLKKAFETWFYTANDLIKAMVTID